MKKNHVYIIIFIMVFLVLSITMKINMGSQSTSRQKTTELIDLRNELVELNRRLNNLDKRTDETIIDILGPDKNSEDINSLIQYVEDGRIQIQLYGSKIAIVIEPSDMVFRALARRAGYIVPVNFSCRKNLSGTCMPGQPYMLYVAKLPVKAIAWASMKNGEKSQPGIIKKIDKTDSETNMLIDLSESRGIEIEVSSSENKALKMIKNTKEGDILRIDFPRDKPYEVRINKNKFAITKVRELSKTAS